ncbi:MAG TPA: SelB C-terminal domain-containing protein, partial [Gemmatimonadales bacterium]|nr:SelB C-terminal domain-containing protein [Gemmatimonadales bacterium]
AEPALPLLLGLPPADAVRVTGAMPDLRPIEGHRVPAGVADAVATELLERVRRHHRDHRSEPGISAETLRQAVRDALRAPPWLVRAVLDELMAARKLESVEGAVRLPGFRPAVSGGGAEVDRVVALLERAGLAPPSVGELAAQVGRDDVAAILRIAAGERRVVMVQRDRYWAAAALDRFVAVLREIGREGEITPAGLRDRLGITRKYLIPLLEWADAAGLTVRTGDARVLRERSAGRPPEASP